MLHNRDREKIPGISPKIYGICLPVAGKDESLEFRRWLNAYTNPTEPLLWQR